MTPPNVCSAACPAMCQALTSVACAALGSPGDCGFQFATGPGSATDAGVTVTLTDTTSGDHPHAARVRASHVPPALQTDARHGPPGQRHRRRACTRRGVGPDDGMLGRPSPKTPPVGSCWCLGKALSDGNPVEVCVCVSRKCV